MMDTSLTQLLGNQKAQNELMRHPMAASLGLSGKRGPSSFMVNPKDKSMGIPAMGEGNSSTGFMDLVAQAQAQAEARAAALTDDAEAARDMARNLSQLRAMGLQNDMLSGMVNIDQGGESDASALVSRMNLESLLMSNDFGNLLGQPNAASGVSAFGSENSGLALKNKLSAKSPNRAAGHNVQIMGVRDTNSRMPYGLVRPPKAARAESENKPEDDYWIEDPLKRAAAEFRDGDYWIEDPLKNTAAQKSLPEEKHWYDDPLKKAAGKLSRLADVARAISEAPASEKDIIAAQRAGAAGASAENGFSRDELETLVRKVGLALDMDPNLVKAVIKTESNFNHKAVSKAGAKGLMQLMPGTAKDLGVSDPFNPVENVWAGARYLKKMLDRHGGNLNNALASYNWGPGNFDRKGKARMPGETRRYISTVNQHYAKFKQEGKA